MQYETSNIRKYSFCSPVIIWNSFPDHVVEADSINSFKSRLDKYWTNWDVLYNYDCDLTETGKVYQSVCNIVVWDAECVLTSRIYLRPSYHIGLNAVCMIISFITNQLRIMIAFYLQPYRPGDFRFVDFDFLMFVIVWKNKLQYGWIFCTW